MLTGRTFRNIFCLYQTTDTGALASHAYDQTGAPAACNAIKSLISLSDNSTVTGSIPQGDRTSMLASPSIVHISRTTQSRDLHENRPSCSPQGNRANRSADSTV